MGFVDRQVLLRLDQRCRETAQRKLVAFAKREHAKVMETSRPSDFVQTVDGRKNAPFDAVKANGIIHVDYGYMEEIARKCLHTLEMASPVATGAYVEEHSIFVDGQEREITNIGMASRMVIANVKPYARVIEVGVGKRVPWSKQPQVPQEGVYRHAVRLLRREYSGTAAISFGWVGVEHDRETGSNERGKRFPAVIVESK